LTSDPQPGAVLDAPPANITLKFNEPVEISLGAIRVFDGTGNSIDVSAARHPGGDASAVQIDLPKLADGSYVVDWRVVSSDSHPFTPPTPSRSGRSRRLPPACSIRSSATATPARAPASASRSAARW
jgi:hypothetical protein